MSFSTLTKASSQLTPYFWVWLPDSTGVNVWKYMGTTRYEMRGKDDTGALAKINFQEGFLDTKGKTIHG